jgi:hypothetical protein
MPNVKEYKEKLKEIKKKRLKSFFISLTLILFIATVAAVGFIWLEMKNVFIFIFLAYLPGILSVLWDKKPGRFASKTVFALNATGTTPYLFAIFSSGAPDSVAINSLNDPLAWLLIYGFSIFGWGLVYLVPQITMIFLEIKSEYMIKKMQAFQENLVDEWGEEIKR